MKMILQKHTSKFVAGLFNSLGITACVALTACGGENKGKQTENQVENLKNGLKNVEFYKNLADDEDSLKAIADWLNNKNYGSDYKLNAKDLQEIFQNDSKLNEVAEKLGVKLTESEDEPDDEKQKEIQKWVTKLNSLENAEFDKLNEGLKEKVAQKFIDKNIDITNDDDITTKLAGFINEVKDEKKQNEISIKVVGEGKVTITKVANSEITDFVFDTFDVLQAFVENLKDKEITQVEGKLSFVFEGESVKICGHGRGFKVADCFEKFLNCFGVLARIENLNLNVSGLSLTVEGGNLKLNEITCSDGYFKETKFWTLVKDHAAFFGITEDDENKFEIGKDGDDESAVVKIGDFKSSLKWSGVVNDEDNGFVVDSGWDNIFKLKSKEEPKEVVGDENKVTIEWSATKGYKLGDNSEFVKIESLDTLGQLVGDLNNKTVKELKGDFTLTFEGQNVKICGGKNIDITIDTVFEQLLGYVKTLKDTNKAINSGGQIQIAPSSKNGIMLNNGGIKQDFIKTATFWTAVKNHKELFGGLPINVVQYNRNGQIGSTVIGVEMFRGKDIDKDWKEIFKKSR